MTELCRKCGGPRTDQPLKKWLRGLADSFDRAADEYEPHKPITVSVELAREMAARARKFADE